MVCDGTDVVVTTSLHSHTWLSLPTICGAPKSSSQLSMEDQDISSSDPHVTGEEQRTPLPQPQHLDVTIEHRPSAKARADKELCATPVVIRVPKRHMLRTPLGAFVEEVNLMHHAILLSYFGLIPLAVFGGHHLQQRVKILGCMFQNVYPFLFYLVLAHRVNKGILIQCLATFESSVVHIAFILKGGFSAYLQNQADDPNHMDGSEMGICDYVHLVVYLPLGTILACSDAIELDKTGKLMFSGISLLYCIGSWMTTRFPKTFWFPEYTCNEVETSHQCTDFVPLTILCTTLLFCFTIKKFIAYLRGHMFSTVRPIFTMASDDEEVHEDSGEDGTSDGSDSSDAIEVNHKGGIASLESLRSRKAVEAPPEIRANDRQGFSITAVNQRFDHMRQEAQDMSSQIEDMTKEAHGLRERLEAAFEAVGTSQRTNLKEAILSLKHQLNVANKQLQKEQSQENAKQTLISVAMQAAAVEKPSELAHTIFDLQSKLDNVARMLNDATEENATLRNNLKKVYRTTSRKMFQKACVAKAPFEVPPVVLDSD